MLHVFNVLQPVHSVLCVLLDCWPQYSLGKLEIINCAKSEYTRPWVAPSPSVHQRPARTAKEVGHDVSLSLNRFRLAELIEMFLPTNVFQMRIEDDKSRGKHGCCDFAAVAAMADKGENEAWLG